MHFSIFICEAMLGSFKKINENVCCNVRKQPLYNDK